MRTKRAYAGAAAMLQPRTLAPKIAPYSQQLGDFFTPRLFVVVKRNQHNYRRGWGSPI
jgi:hypothetical protein